MLPFDYRSGPVRLHGLTSMSQESLAAPRLVFTYVNNRPVRDRILMRAIARAYETLLPRGRHPAVALFIELPPEEVDVNVHPMKTEVRFRRAGQIFELVYFVLRDRLKDQTSSELTPKDSASAREQQTGIMAGDRRKVGRELHCLGSENGGAAEIAGANAARRSSCKARNCDGVHGADAGAG